MLGAFNYSVVHLDTIPLNDTLLGKVRQINPLNCNFSSNYPHRVPRGNAVQNCAFSRDYFSHLKIHHLSHQNPSKTWLVRINLLACLFSIFMVLTSAIKYPYL